jgi:hypothetical protein
VLCFCFVCAARVVVSGCVGCFFCLLGGSAVVGVGGGGGAAI